MDFVRWLHPVHFDPRSNCFKSLAFKNSSGGGVSIVEVDCALTKSPTLENHARTFYPTKVGPKVMYWKFDENPFPVGASISEEESDTKDVCHRNVSNVNDKDLRATLKSKAITDFVIVDNGAERSLQRTDFPP